MKLIPMTICAAALIIGAKAFAGNPAEGTDDPHVTPPALDCAALYARYPSKPTKHQARVWSMIFAPCVWEGERRKPRPKPCRKPIEDKGGAIILVVCGHELTEGQSE